MMTPLVVAVVAVGTVTALHWAPATAVDPGPPVASAHDHDMAPRSLPSLPGAPGAAAEPGAAASRAPSPQGSGDRDRPDDTRTPARDRTPVYLRIPELGVESPTTRTSMDDEGIVSVPEDVTTTAWFDLSRRVGARFGSAVIVGHRDSATQGSGALFGIEELPIGADITVTARDGTQYDYTVASIEYVDKVALPDEAARIFTKRGPHRLVLITCGGAFDEAARSYLSNIIVTALPATGD